jgi:hypothetical protein
MAALAAILLPLAGQAQSAEETPAQPAPCTSGDHRDFDFWLGDWEVRSADGQLQGHNRIASVESGCAVTEHWLGAGGSTGRSINYFHPGEGRWHQQWVSPGVIIRIAGTRDGNAMRLSGDIFYIATGASAPFRGTWTLLPDGRVEQLFEQSADSGETWSTWFRGFYTRLGDATEAGLGAREAPLAGLKPGF